MKPLFLRADNSLPAGCFIGALGLSLAALTIFAQTPAVRRRDRHDKAK